MDIIIKTVKQYSYELNNDTLKELQFIANQYKNVKNYVYSRYSGINSIHILKDYKKQIRDKWVKTKFAGQWKLPARYWKMALDEAISNIKTEWSNVKNRIRICVNNNEENLTKDDKYYINYILKADKLYHYVLTNKEYDIPKVFENKELNYKYLNNMIKRVTRRYKGKVSYTHKSNKFSIDADMYSYELDDKLFFNLMTTKKGKRVKIQLKDKNIYSGNLKIIIQNNSITIHKPLKIKTKSNNYENILGIDKGYKYLFAVSTNRFYGENLNYYLNKETERLNKINQNRNRLYALYNSYLEQGNMKKADNILKNNLGKVKYNHNKNKHDQTVKSYINYSLNQLIQNEKPKEIVIEQLDFVSWDDKYPKSIKRKLSRWIKGYIRERIEYKCDFNSIKYTYINPAYTSKVCNVCGSFGKRNNDIFTCPKCRELDADINASINILNRKYDKEITLYTNYKKVKKILENRLKVS